MAFDATIAESCDTIDLDDLIGDMKAMTRRQFSDAIEVRVTGVCGSVQLFISLIFGNATAAQTAVEKVDSTPPAAMTREWFENITTGTSRRYELFCACMHSHMHTACAHAQALVRAPILMLPIPCVLVSCIAVVGTTRAVMQTALYVLAPSPPPPSPPPPSPPPTPPPAPMPPLELFASALTVAGPYSTYTAEEDPLASEVTSAIRTSIMLSITGSVAASAAASAGAGTAGGAAGGASAGGGVAPLLFGAQRFMMSANVGAAPTQLQQRVCNSLSFVSGELSLIPTPSSPSRRRMASEDDVDEMPAELVSLLNLMVTCVLAMLMTCGLQYFLVTLWRHLVNRRYYAQQRAIAGATSAGNETALQIATEWRVGPERFCCDVFGPKRILKPPKFMPYPKSLVWPTPLFFSGCIFVTGLTRASVRLLAADPLGCGTVRCRWLPIGVIVGVLIILMIIGSDLLRFRREHGVNLKWKPAARPNKPGAVTDPWMQLRAHWVVCITKWRIAVSYRLRRWCGVPPAPQPNAVTPLSRPATPATAIIASMITPEGVLPNPPTGATGGDAAASSEPARLAAADARAEALGMQQPSGGSEPASATTPARLRPSLMDAIMTELDDDETERRLAAWSVLSKAEHGQRQHLRQKGSSLVFPVIPQPPDRTARFDALRRDIHASPKAQMTVPRYAQPTGLALLRAAVPPSSGPPTAAQLLRAGQGLPLRSGLPHTRPRQSPSPGLPPRYGLPPRSGPPSWAPSAVDDCTPPKYGRTHKGSSPLSSRPLGAELVTAFVPAASVPTPSYRSTPAVSSSPAMSAQSSLSPSGSPRSPPPSPPWAASRNKRTCSDALSVVPSAPASAPSSVLADRRAKAIEQLSASGFRDRKSGAFGGVPDADVKEPERTERLLAAPFAIRRERMADSWQGLEGFLLFRVHGASRVSTCYRLIVVGVNMIFGVISGLSPLVTPGSFGALVQSSCILGLQMGMSFLCFYYLPDADRIISRFAGTQFLFEGLATGSLITAERLARPLSGAFGDGDANATGPFNMSGIFNVSEPFDVSALNATALDASSSDGGALSGYLRISGFVMSLVAMVVPIAQLLEQRCVTPYVNFAKKGSANPVVLLAAAYMILASLPRQLDRFLSAALGGGMDAAQAAESASADAGDEAVVAEQGGDGVGDGGGDSGGGGDGDGGGEGGGDGGSAANEGGAGREEGTQGAEDAEEEAGAPSVGLSGDMVGDAATRASRLLARAMAAKEVAAKNLAPSTREQLGMSSESTVVPSQVADNKLAAVVEEGEHTVLGGITHQMAAALAIQRRVESQRSMKMQRANATVSQEHARQQQQQQMIAEDGDDDDDAGGGGED